MRTLASAGTGRDNNFNLIRMIAASAVLVSHSYPIALAALRRPSESAFALYRARQINPRVTDSAQSLVSFDQD